MANVPVYAGSSSFFPGDTAFGFYDYQYDFQVDADAIVTFVTRRLGWPIEVVELQPSQIYTAFEEAVTVYGNEVYQFQIRENMLSMEGNLTGSGPYNNVLMTPSLGGVVRIADNYGEEAGVGGNTTWYSGSVMMYPGTQSYNLNTWASQSASLAPGDYIEIKRVFYEAPPASMRFYDPYLGNQAMLDTFGFGAYSTGVSFMLMPMYADLLRVQAIEFNDMMRKSAFTFEIINNEMRIFPIPTKDFKLWIEYIVKEERSNPLKYPDGQVSDMSNAPYDFMLYSKINSVGKSWIYSFGLALTKEMLGYVRGKYGSIPIPNGETSLNAADLLSAAGTEKQALVDQLRTMLDTMTRSKLLEAKRLETESLSVSLNGTPLSIYIG